MRPAVGALWLPLALLGLCLAVPVWAGCTAAPCTPAVRGPEASPDRGDCLTAVFYGDSLLGSHAEEVSCASVNLMVVMGLDGDSTRLDIYSHPEEDSRGISVVGKDVELTTSEDGECIFKSKDRVELYIGYNHGIDIYISGANCIYQHNTVEIDGLLQLGNQENPISGVIELADNCDLKLKKLVIFDSCSLTSVISNNGGLLLDEDNPLLLLKKMPNRYNDCEGAILNIGSNSTANNSGFLEALLLDIGDACNNLTVNISSVTINKLFVVNGRKILMNLLSISIKHNPEDNAILLKDERLDFEESYLADYNRINLFVDNVTELALKNSSENGKDESIDIRFGVNDNCLYINGIEYRIDNEANKKEILLNSSIKNRKEKFSLVGLGKVNDPENSKRMFSTRSKTDNTDQELVIYQYDGVDVITQSTIVDRQYDFVAKLSGYGPEISNLSVTLTCSTCRINSVSMSFSENDEKVFLSNGGSAINFRFSKEEFGITNEDTGIISISAIANYNYGDERGRKEFQRSFYVLAVDSISGKMLSRDENEINLHFEINYKFNSNSSGLKKELLVEGNGSEVIPLSCFENICTFENVQILETNNKFTMRFSSDFYDGYISIPVSYNSCFDNFQMSNSSDSIGISVVSVGSSCKLTNATAYFFNKQSGEKSSQRSLNEKEGVYSVSNLTWNSSDDFDRLCIQYSETVICRTIIESIKPTITDVRIVGLYENPCGSKNYVSSYIGTKVFNFEVSVNSLSRISSDFILVFRQTKEEKCSIQATGSTATNKVNCGLEVENNGEAIEFGLKFSSNRFRVTVMNDTSGPSCSNSEGCLFMEDLYKIYTPDIYTTPEFLKGDSVIIGNPLSVLYELENISSTNGVNFVEISVLGFTGKKFLTRTDECDFSVPQQIEFDLFELLPYLVLPDGKLVDLSVTVTSYSGSSNVFGIKIIKNPLPEINFINALGYPDHNSEYMDSHHGFITYPHKESQLEYELVSYHYGQGGSSIFAEKGTIYPVSASSDPYKNVYNYISDERHEHYDLNRSVFVKVVYMINGKRIGSSFEPTTPKIGMCNFNMKETKTSENKSALLITPLANSDKFINCKNCPEGKAFMKLNESESFTECSKSNNSFICELKYQKGNWNGVVEFTYNGATLNRTFPYDSIKSVYPPIKGVELVAFDNDSVADYLYKDSKIQLVVTLENQTSFYPGGISIDISIDGALCDKKGPISLDFQKSNTMSTKKIAGPFVFKNICGILEEDYYRAQMSISNIELCVTSGACTDSIIKEFNINDLKPRLSRKNDYNPERQTIAAYNEVNLDVVEQYKFCARRYGSWRTVLIGKDKDSLLKINSGIGPFDRDTTQYIRTKMIEPTKGQLSEYKSLTSVERECDCDYGNTTTCQTSNEEPFTRISHYYIPYKISTLISDPKPGVLYKFQVTPYGRSKIPGDTKETRFIWFKSVDCYAASTSIVYRIFNFDDNNDCGGERNGSYCVNYNEHVFWVRTDPEKEGIIDNPYYFYPYMYDYDLELDDRERGYSTISFTYYDGKNERTDSYYRTYRALDSTIISNGNYRINYSLKGEGRECAAGANNFFTDFKIENINDVMSLDIGNCNSPADMYYMSFGRNYYTSTCTCNSNIIKCSGLYIPATIGNEITVISYPVKISKEFQGFASSLSEKISYINESKLNEKFTPETVYVKYGDQLKFEFYFKENESIRGVEFSYSVSRKGDPNILIFQADFDRKIDSKDDPLTKTFNNLEELVGSVSINGDKFQITFSNPVINFKTIEKTTTGQFTIIRDDIAPECRKELGFVGPYGTCIYFSDTIDTFEQDRFVSSAIMHENVVNKDKQLKIIIGPIQHRPGSLERIDFAIYDDTGAKVLPSSDDQNEMYSFRSDKQLGSIEFGTTIIDGITVSNIAYYYDAKEIDLSGLIRGKIYTIKARGVNKSGVVSNSENEAMKLDFVIGTENIHVEHFLEQVDKTVSPHQLTLRATPMAYCQLPGSESTNSGIVSKVYISEISCGETSLWSQAVENGDFYYFPFMIKCNYDSVITAKIGYYGGDINSSSFTQFRGFSSYISSDTTYFKDFSVVGRINGEGKKILNAELSCRENLYEALPTGYVTFVSNGYNFDKATECQVQGVSPVFSMDCSNLYITSTWENVLKISYAGTIIIQSINPIDISVLLPYMLPNQTSLNGINRVDNEFIYINDYTNLVFNYTLSGETNEYSIGLWVDIVQYELYSFTDQHPPEESQKSFKGSIVSLQIDKDQLNEKGKSYVTTKPTTILSMLSESINQEISSGVLSTNGDYLITFRNVSTYPQSSGSDGSIIFRLRVDNSKPDCMNNVSGGRCIFTAQPYDDFIDIYTDTNNRIYDQIYEGTEHLKLILGPFKVLDSRNAGSILVSVIDIEENSTSEFIQIQDAEIIDVSKLIKTGEDSKVLTNPAFKRISESESQSDSYYLMYYYLDIGSKYSGKLTYGKKYSVEAIITTKCGVSSTEVIVTNFIIKPNITAYHKFGLIDYVNGSNLITFYVGANTTPLKENEEVEKVPIWIKDVCLINSNQCDYHIENYDKDKSREYRIVPGSSWKIDSEFEITVGFYEDIKGSVKVTSNNRNSVNDFALSAMEKEGIKVISVELKCSEKYQNCAIISDDMVDKELSISFVTDAFKIQDEKYDSVAIQEFQEEMLKKSPKSVCEVEGNKNIICGGNLIIDYNWWDFVSVTIGGTTIVNEVNSENLRNSIPYLSNVYLNDVVNGGLVYISNEKSLDFNFIWSIASSNIVNSLKATLNELGDTNIKEFSINTFNGSLTGETTETQFSYSNISELFGEKREEDGTHLLKIRNTSTMSLTECFLQFTLLKVDTEPTCVNSTKYNGCVNLVNDLNVFNSGDGDLENELSTQIINEASNLKIAIGPFDNYQYHSENNEISNSSYRFDDLNIKNIKVIITDVSKSGNNGEDISDTSLTIEEMISSNDVIQIDVQESDVQNSNIKRILLLLDMQRYASTLKQNSIYKFKFELTTKSDIKSSKDFLRLFMVKPDLKITHNFNIINDLYEVEGERFNFLSEYRFITLNGPLMMATLCITDENISINSDNNCKSSDSSIFGPFYIDKYSGSTNHVSIEYEGINGILRYDSVDKTSFIGLEIEITEESVLYGHKLVISLRCPGADGCVTTDLSKKGSLIFLDDTKSYSRDEIESVSGENCSNNSDSSYVCSGFDVSSNWSGNIEFKNDNMILLTKTEPSSYYLVLPYIINMELEQLPYGNVYYLSDSDEIRFTFTLLNKSLDYISDLKIEIYGENEQIIPQTRHNIILSQLVPGQLNNILFSTFSNLKELFYKDINSQDISDRYYKVRIYNTITAPFDRPYFEVNLKYDNKILECTQDTNNCVSFVSDDSLEIPDINQLIYDKDGVDLALGPFDTSSVEIREFKLIFSDLLPEENIITIPYTSEMEKSGYYWLTKPFSGVQIIDGKKYTLQVNIITKSGLCTELRREFMVNPNVSMMHTFLEINKVDLNENETYMTKLRLNYEMSNNSRDTTIGDVKININEVICDGLEKLSKSNIDGNVFNGYCSIDSDISVYVSYNDLVGTQILLSKNVTPIRSFDIKSNKCDTSSISQTMSNVELTLIYLDDNLSTNEFTPSLSFITSTTDNEEITSSVCIRSEITTNKFICTNLFVSSNWKNLIKLSYGETSVISSIDPTTVGNAIPYFSSVHLNGKEESELINIDPNTPIEFEFTMILSSTESINGVIASVSQCIDDINDGVATTCEEKWKQITEFEMIFNNDDKNSSVKSIEYESLSSIEGLGSLSNGLYKISINNISTNPNKEQQHDFLLKYTRYYFNCLGSIDGNTNSCMNISTDFSNFEEELKKSDELTYGGIIERKDLMDKALYLLIGPVNNDSDMIDSIFLNISQEGKDDKIIYFDSEKITKYEDKNNDGYVYMIINISNVNEDLASANFTTMTSYIVPKYSPEKLIEENKVGTLNIVNVGTISMEYDYKKIISPLDDEVNIMGIDIKGNNESDHKIVPIIDELYCNGIKDTKYKSNSETNAFETTCDPSDDISSSIHYIYQKDSENSILIPGSRIINGNYKSKISGVALSESQYNNPFRLSFDILCKNSNNCGLSFDNGASDIIEISFELDSGVVKNKGICERKNNSLLCGNFVIDNNWNGLISINSGKLAVVIKFTKDEQVDKFYNSIPKINHASLNGHEFLSIRNIVELIKQEPITLDIGYEIPTTVTYSKLFIEWYVIDESVDSSENKVISSIDLEKTDADNISSVSSYSFYFNDIVSLLGGPYDFEQNNRVSLTIATPKRNGENGLNRTELSMIIDIQPMTTTCENLSLDNGDQCLYIMGEGEKYDDLENLSPSKIIFSDHINEEKFVIGKYINVVIPINGFKALLSSDEKVIWTKEVEVFEKYDTKDSSQWFEIDISSDLIECLENNNEYTVTFLPLFENRVTVANQTNLEARLTFYYTKEPTFDYKVTRINEDDKSVEISVYVSSIATIYDIDYVQKIDENESNKLYKCTILQTYNSEQFNNIQKDCDPYYKLFATYKFEFYKYKGEEVFESECNPTINLSSVQVTFNTNKDEDIIIEFIGINGIEDNREIELIEVYYQEEMGEYNASKDLLQCERVIEYDKENITTMFTCIQHVPKNNWDGKLYITIPNNSSNSPEFIYTYGFSESICQSIPVITDSMVFDVHGDANKEGVIIPLFPDEKSGEYSFNVLLSFDNPKILNEGDLLYYYIEDSLVEVESTSISHVYVDETQYLANISISRNDLEEREVSIVLLGIKPTLCYGNELTEDSNHKFTFVKGDIKEAFDGESLCLSKTKGRTSETFENERVCIKGFDYETYDYLLLYLNTNDDIDNIQILSDSDNYDEKCEFSKETISILKQESIEEGNAITVASVKIKNDTNSECNNVIDQNTNKTIEINCNITTKYGGNLVVNSKLYRYTREPVKIKDYELEISNKQINAENGMQYYFISDESEFNVDFSGCFNYTTVLKSVIREFSSLKCDEIESDRVMIEGKEINYDYGNFVQKLNDINLERGIYRYELLPGNDIIGYDVEFCDPNITAPILYYDNGESDEWDLVISTELLKQSEIDEIIGNTADLEIEMFEVNYVDQLFASFTNMENGAGFSGPKDIDFRMIDDKTGKEVALFNRSYKFYELNRPNLIGTVFLVEKMVDDGNDRTMTINAMITNYNGLISKKSYKLLMKSTLTDNQIEKSAIKQEYAIDLLHLNQELITLPLVDRDIIIKQSNNNLYETYSYYSEGNLELILKLKVTTENKNARTSEDDSHVSTINKMNKVVINLDENEEMRCKDINDIDSCFTPEDGYILDYKYESGSIKESRLYYVKYSKMTCENKGFFDPIANSCKTCGFGKVEDKKEAKCVLDKNIILIPSVCSVVVIVIVSVVCIIVFRRKIFRRCRKMYTSDEKSSCGETIDESDIYEYIPGSGTVVSGTYSENYLSRNQSIKELASKYIVSSYDYSGKAYSNITPISRDTMQTRSSSFSKQYDLFSNTSGYSSNVFIDDGRLTGDNEEYTDSGVLE